MYKDDLAAARARADAAEAKLKLMTVVEKTKKVPEEPKESWRLRAKRACKDDLYMLVTEPVDDLLCYGDRGFVVLVFRVLLVMFLISAPFIFSFGIWDYGDEEVKKVVRPAACKSYCSYRFPKSMGGPWEEISEGVIKCTCLAPDGVVQYTYFRLSRE